MPVLIGLDHGGSATTALVLADTGVTLGRASVPMPKRSPKPGWVEHDPEDFFLTSIAACADALVAADCSWADVGALGIANQGETTMAWSRSTGKALGAAISWEDRRTVAFCDGMNKAGHGDLVRARTGLFVDPYFSASKIRWLFDDLGTDPRDLCVGGSDAYVMHRLTDGEVYATDSSTASRTALFNIRENRWDEELMELFGVSAITMPEIRPSAGAFGQITSDRCSATPAAITGDLVDAHAALYAQDARDSSTIKATFGTGAFVEVNTGPTLVPPNGDLLNFVAWDIDGRRDFTIEGGVFDVGSAVDWAVSAGWVPSAHATAELAASVADSQGVVFVPSFSGLAAPHWVAGARASVLGLSLDTTPAHIARALLEGIAHSVADVVDALHAELGATVQRVCADGGPSANPTLMQLQADLLGVPVSVSHERDMTALGAAFVAGVGGGFFADADTSALRPEARIFEPVLDEASRRERRERWAASVHLVREYANAAEGEKAPCVPMENLVA